MNERERERERERKKERSERGRKRGQYKFAVTSMCFHRNTALLSEEQLSQLPVDVNHLLKVLYSPFVHAPLI